MITKYKKWCSYSGFLIVLKHKYLKFLNQDKLILCLDIYIGKQDNNTQEDNCLVYAYLKPCFLWI